MSEMNMNGSHDAEESVEAAAESFKTMEENVGKLFDGMDMAVPEAMRAMAEQTVTQSREAYESAKGAMEDAVEVLEQSIDQAGQGAAAFNRKVIDIAQANLNTGFDLAKGMAGARNLAEIMELQSAFARKHFETFTAQAEEMRTLSAKITEDATAPIKDHMTRSIDKATTS